MSGRKAAALRRLAKRHRWSRWQYQQAKRGYKRGDPIIIAVVKAEARRPALAGRRG